MKKILFLLAMLPMMCYGQNYKIDENTTELVIVTDCNIKKDIKYSNTKEWIAKTFGDYKSVVQYEDKEECKIIIKGNTPLEKEEHTSYEGLLGIKIIPLMNYTITIECKDERYRFTMDGMSVDVKQIRSILGSPSIDTKSYSIKEFVNLILDGAITNPEEMIQKTNNKINIASIKLDSLKSIDASTLKKKEQRKLANLISSTENDILMYKKNIAEYVIWESKHEKRMEDIRSNIILLHESLSKSICKKDEW